MHLYACLMHFLYGSFAFSHALWNKHMLFCSKCMHVSFEMHACMHCPKRIRNACKAQKLIRNASKMGNKFKNKNATCAWEMCKTVKKSEARKSFKWEMWKYAGQIRYQEVNIYQKIITSSWLKPQATGRAWAWLPSLWPCLCSQMFDFLLAKDMYATFFKYSQTTHAWNTYHK